MIHFHGTPLTPRAQLLRLAGKHFCVSFAEPRDADTCMAIGQSVLWDNGAFSIFTRGAAIDEQALYRWLEPRIGHPHRGVVLDRIGGDEDAQRAMVRRWPFPKALSWPVWHLDRSLDYLDELVDSGWSGVCFGSAGPYWQIGSRAWERRMDQAFDHLARNGALPWIHGLRMLSQTRWPLASADSVNVARNHASAGRDPLLMANEIDARQSPIRWTPRPKQLELAA